MRAHRAELGVQHANVAQVFQLGPVAGKHIKADEVRGLRRMLVVVGRVGRHRHGDLHRSAVVGHAHFNVVDRCMRGMAVAGVLGGIAVPLLHLGKKAQQIGLGAVAVAALGQQDAGGQRGIQAQHQLVVTDRRRRAFGAQQAGKLKRAQPALHPLRLVGRQHGQRIGRAGIGQDGAAQLFGMRRLVGNELSPGQRGHAGQRVKAEGHGQRFFFGDVYFGVGGQELPGQALRYPVEAGNAFVEQAGGLPIGADGIQLVAQAGKVVVDPLGQARIGLHLEAGAGKAVGGHIKRIARGQVPAVGVVGTVQCGPRHIGAHAGGGRGAVGLVVAITRGNCTGRLAAHIGTKHHIRQVQAFQHIGAVAHVAGAYVKAHIRRVHIAQALQADAEQRRVARVDRARTANADGRIHLDHALYQVAVGLDHPLAVGVGHQHVIQAQRHMAQVKHRADVGGVQHLPALGLDLKLTGPGQLDQGTGRKTRAFDVHRHPAVVVVTHTALVRGDFGDGQRQQVSAQRYRRIKTALAGAHQDVVIARLGGGHQQGLVGRDGVAVGHIKQAGGGHVVPADVHLVGTGAGA